MTIAKISDVDVEFESLVVDAAEAEHHYDLNYSIAYLKSEGTVPERQAMASQLTQSEHLKTKILDARVRALNSRIVNLRQELSAYQSLLSVQKAEMGMAR